MPAVRGDGGHSPPPNNLNLMPLPERGDTIIAHGVSRGLQARLNWKPRQGRHNSSAFVSPLTGLICHLVLVPTANAVGYNYVAPDGAEGEPPYVEPTLITRRLFYLEFSRAVRFNNRIDG